MRKPYILSIATTAAALSAVLLLAPATANGQSAADTTARAKGGAFPWQLTVYDRQGKVVHMVGELADESYPPVFSPDGTRLAVVKAVPGAPGADVSVFNLSTGASTQVLSGPAPRGPVWSPDGSQIAYFSYRQRYGGLYRKASTGTGREELLYRFPLGISDVHLTDWSPDGRFLVFDTAGVVWLLPIAGERKAVELVREDFQVFGARFSPDSRFLAYNSDESSRNEIYVRAFDSSSGRFSPAGGRWKVSGQGGLGMVHWRRDGRELYYLAPDGGVMAVDVTTTPTFTAGPPRLLFRAPITIPLEDNPNDDQYGSVSRDGQRVAFRVLTPPERKVVTVAPEILAQYTGRYVAGSNSVVVALEGNRLMIQGVPGYSDNYVPGSDRATQKNPLFAESETNFFLRLPDNDNDIEFVKDDKGAVTHFLVSGGIQYFQPIPKWTRTDTNAKAKGGPFPHQLIVYDRQGKVLRTVGEPGSYYAPALSPDGTQVAVVKLRQQAQISGSAATGADIWLCHLSTGTSTQVTSGRLQTPVWSPDGSQIAYFSYRQGYGGLYRKASTGTGRERLLYRFPRGLVEVYGTDWSPDGRFLAFDTDGVLWVLPLTRERTPVELVRAEFLVSQASFSPDSRFLAYSSDESGRLEVYVRAFDPSSGRFSPVGGPWQVSGQVDANPQASTLAPDSRTVQWRRDGGELYYVTADGEVMAVEVITSPSFKAGPPKLLFRVPSTRAGSISPDGQRFAFVVPMPPERNVVTVAPDILAQYTGTYVNPEGDEGLVSLEGNQLMFKPTEGEKVPLFAESEIYFFRRFPDNDADFEFVRNEQGEVASFIRYTGVAGTNWTRK